MTASDARPFDLIIAGGGAAGFFGAICAAERNPGWRILILEKTTKLLSKVRISGGGRCNVTHSCFEPSRLSQHYPRGQRELKKMFRVFQATDTVAWFARHGVSLVAEEDGRMFPESNDSQTIISCFIRESERLNIEILTENAAEKISSDGTCYTIQTSQGKEFKSRRVLVAGGGHNSTQAYNWLRDFGHRIIPTIPSLFTFNDSEKKFADLMGVAAASAEVKIAGSDFRRRGPVLITHWGLSGPAVIALSSWAAEYLHSLSYEFTALINWTGGESEENMRAFLIEQRVKNGKRKMAGNPLFSLPIRLWTRLSEVAGIPDSKVWADASNKDINRLIEFLFRCPFAIKGKTTFKEEFVSCGGVDLAQVNIETMESKIHPGLYFAGEVLNIDGETGGFNFQAAWTTAFVASQSMTG